MKSLRESPWLIAGMGLVLLMVTNGLTATAVSVFDEALLREFGWSRGDLKFRDFLSFGIVALLAPVSGWLLDRLGARRLLIAGLAVLAVAYLAFGRIDSLWQMYAIYVLFAFALLTSGTMVVIVLVSSWFVARRGQAVGIALVGTSLGTFLFSPLNVALIEVLGWRRAFAFEALIPLTALLLVILCVRNSPTEFGGRPLGVQDGAIDPRTVGLSFAEAFRTRTFWAISLSGFLTYYSILALFNHLFLHMRGLGFQPADAGKALSLLALLAMAGKLGSGWLGDRFDRHRVFMANITLMFIGVAGLATLRGGWFVWACVTLIGLGWGGLFTLYNMLTVNNFGLKEIGRINGAVSTLESFGGGLGIWLTGRLYDQHQSYGVPFAVLAGCVFTGLVIGAFIRNELQRRQVSGG